MSVQSSLFLNAEVAYGFFSHEHFSKQCSIVEIYERYKRDYYLTSSSLYYVSAEIPQFVHVTSISSDPDGSSYIWKDKQYVGRVYCEEPMKYIEFIRMPFDEKQKIICKYWTDEDV